MTADRGAENLVSMMEDREVPFGVRAKIAQDLLDRAGVIATQVHQIIPMTEDPIIRFFEGVFSDPSNWEENPPQSAIEEPVIDRPDPDQQTSRAPKAAVLCQSRLCKQVGYRIIKVAIRKLAMHSHGRLAAH